MSWKGVKRFAKLLTDAQLAMDDLMRLGTKGDISEKSAQQDILLAHLCNDLKEAVKWKFIKITQMKIKGTRHGKTK